MNPWEREVAEPRRSARRFGLELLSLLSIVLAGCAKRPIAEAVRVDVSGLTSTTAPARTTFAAPRPPSSLPAKSVSLPSRPATRLVAEAGIDGAQLAREVDEAQEISLARLRRRLVAVYRREADRFARTQLRALGDPYRKALESLYPAYRKKFEAYAARRAYPAARLAFFVGMPDPNPDDLPPASNLSPLGRYYATEASKARKTLKALDAEFDAVVMATLESVQAIGSDAKAATLAAIEANRDALNRQAMQEATLPLGPRGGGAIRLTLAKAGIAQAPAVPPRTVVVPGMAAPPPAPRVESPQALADARARLLGEARIWAAERGYRLTSGGRDATSEFVRWKSMRAGASPNSPTSSAEP